MHLHREINHNLMFRQLSSKETILLKFVLCHCIIKEKMKSLDHKPINDIIVTAIGNRKYKKRQMTRAKTIKERFHFDVEEANFEFATLFKSPIRRTEKRGKFKPNLFFVKAALFLYCLSSRL